MDSERFDENDPLIDGGGQLPPGAFEIPGPGHAFRDAVWGRTAAKVRWRARRRRGMVLVGLLVAYAAGLGTAYVRGMQSAEPAIEVAQEPATPLPTVPTTSVELLPARLLREPRALALHLANAEPERRKQILKTAGDRYLSDLSNVEMALKCYQRLLDMTPRTEEVQIAPDDNWLLASLKQARNQEVSHENART